VFLSFPTRRSYDLLREFFNACRKNPADKEIYLTESPGLLWHEILERLYLSLYPMLDHISLDINNIEENNDRLPRNSKGTPIILIDIILI
jgi:hypothetical protein